MPWHCNSERIDGVGGGSGGGSGCGGVCEYLLQTYSSPRKFLAGI